MVNENCFKGMGTVVLCLKLLPPAIQKSLIARGGKFLLFGFSRRVGNIQGGSVPFALGLFFLKFLLLPGWLESPKRFWEDNPKSLGNLPTT